MKKDISSHAQANGPAFADSEMIQQAEHVQCTLAMRDHFLRVRRAAMPAGVRQDELIFARKQFPAGMVPVLQASCAAVKQQKRLALPFGFVMYLDAVDCQPLRRHKRALSFRAGKQTIWFGP
jgi:hypothetical protein